MGEMVILSVCLFKNYLNSLDDIINVIITVSLWMLSLYIYIYHQLIQYLQITSTCSFICLNAQITYTFTDVFENIYLYISHTCYISFLPLLRLNAHLSRRLYVRLLTHSFILRPRTCYAWVLSYHRIEAHFHMNSEILSHHCIETHS